MAQERVLTIEFFRYFFIIVLLSWHGQYGYVEKGYLVVEFFFILSGYFLMDSFIRSPDRNALQYTISRVKKTYLEYLIAAVICFLFYGVAKSIVNGSFEPDIIYKFLTEALLLQESGVFQGGFNSPLWYYSVLIIGGYFLYFIVSRLKFGTEFIIPLLCLFSFVYIKFITGGGGLENWSTHGAIYVPLLRGTADIGVGIITRGVVQSKFDRIYNSKILDIVLVFAFILTIGVMTIENISDFYVLLTMPVMIFIGLRNQCFVYRIFKSRIWDKLGRITWEMYLLHGIFISMFNKALQIIAIDANILVFIVLVLFVTVLSFAYKKVCEFLRKLLLRSKVA